MQCSNGFGRPCESPPFDIPHCPFPTTLHHQAARQAWLLLRETCDSGQAARETRTQKKMPVECGIRPWGSSL